MLGRRNNGVAVMPAALPDNLQPVTPLQRRIMGWVQTNLPDAWMLVNGDQLTAARGLVFRGYMVERRSVHGYEFRLTDEGRAYDGGWP